MAFKNQEEEDLFNLRCNPPHSFNINDLTKILPKWQIQIISIDIQEEDAHPLLRLHFYIKANAREEFNNWRAEFEELNKTTYSIRSSEKGSGQHIHFKLRLNCHHNTGSLRSYGDACSSKSTKNTNCPSKMIVTIHAVKKRYRGLKKEIGDLKSLNPCEIVLIATHNHSILSADALRFRKISEDVKNKLIHMFHCGHSLSTALETLRMEIHVNETDYHIVLADRKFCPDYVFCKNLYMNEFKGKYGSVDFNKEGKEFLQKRLNIYNEEVNSNCVQMDNDELGNYVICICTPLMKRVHKTVKEASQMVFMDASASVDRDGSRVFILLTYSLCGGLPLGIIVTSSEKVEIISRGFEMLKELVGTDIFYGNVNGPKMFLTDDSRSEQLAVNIVFPNSIHLLCIFLVLQSVHRWLRKSSNCIPEVAQKFYFKQFCSILFAQNRDIAYEKFEEAKSAAVSNGNYIKYLEQYWNRKELWVIGYRNGLPTGGNNTNNYSEAAMRLLKDKIFERVKAFNTVQLVDFMLTKFNQYYERRLLDTANNSRNLNNVFGNSYL